MFHLRRPRDPATLLNLLFVAVLLTFFMLPMPPAWTWYSVPALPEAALLMALGRGVRWAGRVTWPTGRTCWDWPDSAGRRAPEPSTWPRERPHGWWAASIRPCG